MSDRADAGSRKHLIGIDLKSEHAKEDLIESPTTIQQHGFELGVRRGEEDAARANRPTKRRTRPSDNRSGQSFSWLIFIVRNLLGQKAVEELLQDWPGNGAGRRGKRWPL